MGTLCVNITLWTYSHKRLGSKLLKSLGWQIMRRRRYRGLWRFQRVFSWLLSGSLSHYSGFWLYHLVTSTLGLYIKARAKGARRTMFLAVSSRLLWMLSWCLFYLSLLLLCLSVQETTTPRTRLRQRSRTKLPSGALTSKTHRSSCSTSTSMQRPSSRTSLSRAPWSETSTSTRSRLRTSISGTMPKAKTLFRSVRTCAQPTRSSHARTMPKTKSSPCTLVKTCARVSTRPHSSKLSDAWTKSRMHRSRGRWTQSSTGNRCSKPRSRRARVGPFSSFRTIRNSCLRPWTKMSSKY